MQPFCNVYTSSPPLPVESKPPAMPVYHNLTEGSQFFIPVGSQPLQSVGSQPLDTPSITIPPIEVQPVQLTQSVQSAGSSTSTQLPQLSQLSQFSQLPQFSGSFLMEPVPGSPGLFKAMGTVPVTDCGLIIGSPVISTSVGSSGTNSSMMSSPLLGSPVLGSAISMPGRGNGVQMGASSVEGDGGESLESPEPVGGRHGPRYREKKVVLKGEVNGVEVVSVMWALGEGVENRPDMKVPKKSQKWTDEEDRLLREAVEKIGERKWIEVSKCRRDKRV